MLWIGNPFHQIVGDAAEQLAEVEKLLKTDLHLPGKHAMALVVAESVLLQEGGRLAVAA